MVFSATTAPSLSVHVNYYLLLVCVVCSHTVYDQFIWNKHALYNGTKNSASLFVEIYSQNEYTKFKFSFRLVLQPLDGS